jgi:hypothetical protein
VGANAVRPIGKTQTEAVVSYFKGSSDEWKTALPTYSSILYPDLWPGVDLTYSGTSDQLKQEFVVEPGADPTKIRLAYSGGTVILNDRGQLEVSTPVGGFTDQAPVAYQDMNGTRVPVDIAFALESATPGSQECRYGFVAPVITPTGDRPGQLVTAGLSGYGL